MPEAALRADLHLHSTASDGLMPPADVALAASSAGLAVAALTDHDTCAGFPDFAAAAARCGLVALCGAEVAAEQAGEEVHLLAYFRRPPAGGYRALLEQLAAARPARALEMVRRLRAMGYPIEADAVLGRPRPGRPHVARALVAAGVVEDPTEAFRRFLTPGAPAYVPRWRPLAADVIALAHGDGGLVALAHPRRSGGDRVEELAAAGLDALEVVHPSADRSAQAELAAQAAEFGLLATGGSDFHAKDDDPPLGRWCLGGAALARFLARLPA